MDVDFKQDAEPARRTRRDALALTWELELDSIGDARFAEVVAAHELPHTLEVRWSTERMTLDGVFPFAVATARTTWDRAAMLDLEPVAGGACIALLTLRGGTAYLHLAARSVQRLADGEAWVRERYPETKPTDDMRVPVVFWSGGQGGRRISRSLAISPWAAIRGNYPRRVADQLAPLLDGFRPSHGGQLLLWFGEPGTGKSHALRALAWEWREWCARHYVTDPERFFGACTEYLLNVLLDDEDDDEGEMWRLIVLEDTGELLTADAKDRTGQGLSRLLNVVDGLIGQGLRVLVLVTTNDRLGTLHPAVARPGRCAACVEFVRFAADEAAA